ncbi:glycosyltransferase family 4 protein [Patescibacteria group bacterium]|nr:glycosyltransferase family 4 protein [Patescibacteria group bacterium]
MNILIATGIYPPEIGGPAQYAMNLCDIWQKQGHNVTTKVFSNWNYLPTGIRHFAYFCSILLPTAKADFVLILDTYSCALPATLACKLFGKKNILRTGGDFLWESYVERTGDLVLFREFYVKKIPEFSNKEKLIFKFTKAILKNVDAIIWSTEWQKNIFMDPYELQNQKHFVVENYYGPRIPSSEPKHKNFIAFTRKLKWKHMEALLKVFNRKDVIDSEGVLDAGAVPHSEFLDTIKNSYAVIIASLGDISPNTILDAISFGKPFILTRETGLYERIKDIALWVDPKNERDVAEKVIWLCDNSNYLEQKRKIEEFTFVHTWEEIAKEYLDIYNTIK